MERVPIPFKTLVQSDILLVWQAIDSGVVVATSKSRIRYWNHWKSYSSQFQISPFLTDVPPLERDIIVTAFAARVRTGYYGRGNQVATGEVRTALAAITKTIELVGERSPLYRADNKYNLQIERCVEGMRRQDPPATPQLALPVKVVSALHQRAQSTTSTKLQAISDLASIAFFYLLRVGEYTRPRVVKKNGKWVRATRTVQFHVGDVGFFKDGKILPRRSPLSTLLQADGATLKITNQKNGRMGETIHHETVKNTPHGPIQALARRVHHIMSNGGSEDNLICDFINDQGIWNNITSTDMRKELRATVTDLKLHLQGIDADLVGVHSLRAGGAMAMKLHGLDDTTIMKQGRWTSLTFLMYIHSQIAHLGKDISTKMSTPLPFTNIASIERQGATSNTSSPRAQALSPRAPLSSSDRKRSRSNTIPSITCQSRSGPITAQALCQLGELRQQ